ncbi:MAG TPA: hypothetical protein VL172_00320 [Kofleriaceae bacterium]|nr:hypothetical protein [Kofleriaceae bacterium]
MAVADRGAAEAAQRIADALVAAGVDYAIGGALALAIAGVPRGTVDVDVNVFVGLDELPRVIDALQALGIAIDIAAATARARQDGMFVGRWDGMRIDVFLPSIPFADEAARTRVQVTDAAGWTGWFLSAEALSVFKLLFFRGKDVIDLERLVAAAGSRLDHAYVRRWIVDMMGEDDERVRRWDDIVTRFAPP